MGILKRNNKRAMAIILSASMVVGSMGISFAANFSDVNNHWAANQIKSLVNKGVVSGYNDGTFKPDNYITRAEFISLINKAFNYKLVYDINYKDTSSKDWFYEDLRKAKAKGYISGYEDNTIRPNNKITRQEVAVIMSKVLNKQYDNKAYVADKFKDSNKIADWSKKSVGALVDSKNMSGYPDGTFGPEKYITRAEAVTVIYKKFKISQSLATSSPVHSYSSSKHSSNDDKKSKKRDDDVEIDDKGDKLKNKTIDGDLTITSDVGDGEVYLEDVTVKGTTYVYGGGEKSIYLEDCDLGKVVVDKKDDKVRLVAQGSTTIDTVTLKSGAILEEDTSGSDKLTKSGFEDVSVEDDNKVTLKGDFDDVDIEVKDADLYLEKGEISKVSIKDDAKDAYIYVASSTKISTIDADERAEVNGSGNVDKIEGSKYKSVSRTESGDRDYTAPKVKGVVSSNAKGKSVNVKLKSNESGKAYYVVLPKVDAVPNKTQVKDGKDSKNNIASLKGNKYVKSEIESIFNITGLKSNTKYKVYVVATDNSGNISTVHSVDVSGVDESTLKDIISIASKNKTTAKVSTDGSDILPTVKWVTKDVMTTYTKAIATAQVIVNKADATQTEIDTAVKALAKATTTFNEGKLDGTKAVVKTTLTGAINAANINKTTATVSIDGSDVLPTVKWVTKDVMTTYTKAIATSQVIVNKTDATQTEVDTAVTELAKSTTTFNEAKLDGTKAVVKTTLTGAIDAANINKTSVKVSIDGSDILATSKWVKVEVMTTYTKAIAKAQVIINKADATQTEVDTAVTALAKATTTFNEAKLDGTKAKTRTN